MSYTLLAIGIGAFLSIILKSYYGVEYLFYLSFAWFFIGGLIIAFFENYFEKQTIKKYQFTDEENKIINSIIGGYLDPDTGKERDKFLRDSECRVIIDPKKSKKIWNKFEEYGEELEKSSEFGIEFGDRVSVGLFSILYIFTLMLIMEGNISYFMIKVSNFFSFINF